MTKSQLALPARDESQALTLRDEFAIGALALAWDAERRAPIGPHGEVTYKGVAMRAYLMADAMLEERDKDRRA